MKEIKLNILTSIIEIILKGKFNDLVNLEMKSIFYSLFLFGGMV